MKRPLRSVFAVVGSVAIWLGAASPSHACCGFFAALFGHHYYGPPAYPAFYGSPVPAAPCCAPVSYRPVGCCPSPCSPCSCSPCGPFGCASGACDVGLAPSSMEPLPDGGAPLGSGAPPGAVPRTFVDEPPASSPMQTPPADEGFRPRGSSEDYDTPPSNSFGPDDSTNQESFRPNSVVPQRDVPPSVPAETATDRDTVLPRLPAFDLNDRITWREPPQRTRLVQHASFGTPLVARTRTNPNQGWLPVPQDTRLVGK